MKKRLLIFVFLFSCVCINAERIQVVFDYTQGVYNSRSYKGIIAAEEDFIKDKPRYEERFVDGFVKYFNGIAFFPTEDEFDASKLFINVIILEVKSNGDTTADVEYLGQTLRFKGKGGVIGTFLNLFGDGMGSLGIQIAKYLNSIEENETAR